MAKTKDPKIYECCICSKKFSAPDGAVNHAEDKHSNMNYHVCTKKGCVRTISKINVSKKRIPVKHECCKVSAVDGEGVSAKPADDKADDDFGRMKGKKGINRY